MRPQTADTLVETLLQENTPAASTPTGVWTPKGSYYLRSGGYKRMDDWNGPPPPVRRGPPPVGERVAVWLSNKGYIGWTSPNAAKAWARKNGGGTTRAGGAWVPGVKSGGDKNKATMINTFGMVADLVEVTDAELSSGDDSYKDAIRKKADEQPWNDFSTAILYQDPERRYEKLKAEYEAELTKLKKELTKRYLDRL